MIRLSKLMAERGICSRREADVFIENGWVRIHDNEIAKLGTRVSRDIEIQLDARVKQHQQQAITVLLNKPVGIVSGQAEKNYRPAVTLITPANFYSRSGDHRVITPHSRRQLAPAGRLDIDSQGLLVLTTDGRVARTLIGPRSDIEKEYLVRINCHANAKTLARLQQGLSLDGHRLKPAQVSQINSEQLRITLREGRKRQIRRMCEQVGLPVTGLKRVRIGRIQLGSLPEGRWRFLGKDEKF